MKSPDEVAARQAQLWANGQVRTRRLLDDTEWPLTISLPKPPAPAVAGRWADVRAHLDAWRAVDVGHIDWEPVPYRATATPIDVPVRWTLANPAEWVAAIGSSGVDNQFERLQGLMALADRRYHKLLVRRLSLVMRTETTEVEAALRIAESVTPGYAAGVPLRALAGIGVDTKFYERNRTLLVALLDVRFEGAASEEGLEGFLGAATSDGHWLLVVDLDGSLLPYQRSRVSDLELADRGTPGGRLLVVENEKCLHVLPPATDTVAVLGAGLNLSWLAADVFADHDVAYWGDIDTWGLRMLAIARAARPGLTPLLMDESIFDRHRQNAVCEPMAAEEPEGLDTAERALFARLLASERGRLEQEFLPANLVRDAVTTWLTELNG